MRQMREHGAKKRGGFSLIEVLITIFILGVVCITLISVFIYGFNLLQKTKKVAMATEIAQAEVEFYRNTPYATIRAISLGSPQNLLPESQTLLAQPEYFASGTGSATFEAIPGADDNIRKLTVHLEWMYRGRLQEKNVVTYIASSGINREE
jgi:prepilin-type N-terminal cleavage/methylation domain-containing protein